MASRLDPYGADDPATETVKARERLQDAGLRFPAVLAILDNAPVAKPSTRARVSAIEHALRRRGDVDSVTDYYGTRSPAFVSHDGRSTYLAVALKSTENKTGAGNRRRDRRRTGEPAGCRSSAATRSPRSRSTSQVEKDLRMAEMLAFPLLFLLSLLFFRSLVAALLPLMIGGLAIVGTFLILRIASEFGGISVFALNLTTALGLGLAIDYSLFIVSRYREEIAKDGPGLAAMRRVLATSGRTVFFSSLTVSAALASLLVFPQSFLYSMGLGGAAGGAVRGADLADRAAGGAVPARRPRQRRRAALPAAPRRGRHPPRRERLLVPALALRDAPADPGGDALAHCC